MPAAPPAPSTPEKSFDYQSRSANSAPVQSRAAVRSTVTSENTPVKDRIRAWQKQGNGVVGTPCPEDEKDATRPTEATDDRGDQDIKKGSAALSMQRHQEDVAGAGTTTRYRKSKWIDPTNREWVRTTRSRSTPRKRVVSDEHWKKRVSLPRSNNTTPTSSRTPQEKDETTLGKGPSGLRHERTISSRTQRDDPGARLERLKAERDREVYGTSEVKSEGENVHASARSRISCNELEAGQASTEDRDEEKVLSDGEMHVQGWKESPWKKKEANEDISLQMDDGRHRRRASHADLSRDALEPERGSLHVRHISTRSRKGGILGHVLDESKKMFAKPDPGFPAPRIPSIEAWLEETPDPFLDPLRDDRSPVITPIPLKARSRRHRPGNHDETRKDVDELQLTVEAPDGEGFQCSGSRRRRKRRSQVPTEDTATHSEDHPEANKSISQDQSHVQDAAENSPTSLKRSAARAHRQRRKSSTPLRESPLFNDRLPSLDPAPTTSKIDDASAPLEMSSKLKNDCPPTGINRLSTIASIETFQTHTDKVHPDKDWTSLDPTLGLNGLKRKLTTHEDLMSVLSLPRTGKSSRSVRSVRSSHRNHGGTTVAQLLDNLAIEEARYLRELRTLVDGVIPVLLHCVLSKSDAAIAAGLFASSGNPEDDLKVTQPIYDMGVCLGRIETLHKRIPLRDANSLLAWAKGAEKVYSEYFKAWRTGFQDVVVNLTPADDETRSRTDGDMSRDENGDVINEDGEKADVAFLLKRPLVRIKKMSKTFNSLRGIMPSSRSTEVSDIFINLTSLARRRSNEEQGRQEDEAATRIDVKRTRDLQTMTIACDVAITKSRSVRARDPFSLTLHHSSGQRYDCQVELLLRDNTKVTDNGDLLICELDNSEKYLLFPPAETQNISARQGDFPGEIILMIRFLNSGTPEAYELLSLQAETEQTSSEWIQMLGSVPLPPRLQRSQSLVDLHVQRSEPLLRGPDVDFTTSSVLSTKEVPNPRDVDAPIGEQTASYSHETSMEPITPEHLSNVSLSSSATKPGSFAAKYRLNPGKSPHTLPTSHQQSQETRQSSRTIRENPDDSKPRSEILKRARAISRRTKRSENSPSNPASDDLLFRHSSFVPPVDHSGRNRNERVSTEPAIIVPSKTKPAEDVEPHASQEPSSFQRPSYHRALSSTPAANLPTIPRLRPSSQDGTVLFNDASRDQWSRHAGDQEPHTSKLHKSNPQQNRPNILDADNSFIPPKQKSDPAGTRPASPPSPPPPPPPPHRSPTSSQVSLPSPHPPKSPLWGKSTERRSSSPLKHEYAPSTASDSTSDSSSAFDDSSSDTSEDDEAGDAHTPLPSFPIRSAYKPSSPSSAPTLPTASLAPSNSASQAPYRSVPTQSHGPKSKSIATIYCWSDRGMWNQLHSDECSVIVTPGLISAYQMSAAHSGFRPAVHPKMVSETTSDSSSYLHETHSDQDRPLVALELTPLVPIRRGTALDISIRSPPTANSSIQSSGNIMFRSRSADECEALYTRINYARINNPTYIALQNARPSIQPPVNFNINGQGSRTNAASRTGSWLFGSGGSRKGPSSFRAPAAPSPGSITAMSENSLANSFSSAMRRFGSSTMFSLNRSSVVRKSQGGGTPSLHSTESGTTTTGGSGSGKTSPAPTQMLLNAAGGAEKTLGINNIKIRLYTRDQPGQPWTHLGSARLSVLSASNDLTKASKDGGLIYDGPSPPQTSGGFGDSRPTSSSDVVQSDERDIQRTPRASTQKGPRLPSSSYTPHRKHGNGREKRVLIVAKSKSKTKPPAVLLDECLGESCFNRVGRIGMAISVWEEELEVKKVGGVVTGKDKIYMVQFHGEAEAAWVFGSVGRMRF